MFADQAKIHIKSGDGGDGLVSFRRELYVPNGGPDGGDGGRGGDVIFEIDEGLNTLYEYRHKRRYTAMNGKTGGAANRHGKDGDDIILRVPRGTVITDAATGKIIADMSGDIKRRVVLSGGRGGLGNRHFATAAMQVPRYAKPGQPGKELEIILELKMIADAGLIGFPNAGKSTFLSRATNASPKIADYHFTTLSPNLGAVDFGFDDGFILADIPGLIEGASRGAGLGHEFLRHIERTKILIHVVDASSTEGRDPVDDIYKINAELASYDADLAKKPQVIAANKIDLLGDEEGPVIRLKETFEPLGVKVFPVSAATGKGLKELLYYVKARLEELGGDEAVFKSEYDPDKELTPEEFSYTVGKDDDEYVVEGPAIEKMLGYTNLDSEKGFAFFQDFLKEKGIIDALKRAGINEGDTVRMYGHSFEYYE